MKKTSEIVFYPIILPLCHYAHWKLSLIIYNENKTLVMLDKFMWSQLLFNRLSWNMLIWLIMSNMFAKKGVCIKYISCKRLKHNILLLLIANKICLNYEIYIYTNLRKLNPNITIGFLYMVLKYNTGKVMLVFTDYNIFLRALLGIRTAWGQGYIAWGL